MSQLKKFKITKKYEAQIEAQSIDEVIRMYENREIMIDSSDFAGVEICEEREESWHSRK